MTTHEGTVFSNGGIVGGWYGIAWFESVNGQWAMYRQQVPGFEGGWWWFRPLRG